MWLFHIKLIKTANAKFNIPNDVVVTCYTEDDGTEVEEDIFLDFNEETVFVIGVKGEKWM